MMRKSTRQRRLSPARNLRYEPLEGRWLLSADVVLMDTTEEEAFESNVRSVVESAIERVIMSDDVGDAIVLESNSFEIESSGHEDPIRVSNVVMEFEPNEFQPQSPQEPSPKLYFTLVLHSNNLAAFRAASEPPDEFFLNRREHRLSGGFDFETTNDVPSLSQSDAADQQKEIDSSDLAESFVTGLREDPARGEFFSDPNIARSIENGFNENATVSGELDGSTDYETNVDGMIRLSLDEDSLSPEGDRQESDENPHTTEEHHSAVTASSSGRFNGAMTLPVDGDSLPIPEGMLTLEYDPTSNDSGEERELQTANAGPMWLLQTFVGWAHGPAPAADGAEESATEATAETAINLRDQWPQVALGCTVIMVTYTWSVTRDRHGKLGPDTDIAN